MRTNGARRAGLRGSPAVGEEIGPEPEQTLWEASAVWVEATKFLSDANVTTFGYAWT